MDLFLRVIFFKISRGFHFANFFREGLFSRILVLSMFSIFWFFRDLFFSHRALTQIFRYFKEHYLNIIDLILDCVIFYKILLTWPSLIDREPHVKMQVLLILKNEKKTNFFLREFNFANLAKIRENRENLSRK